MIFFCCDLDRTLLPNGAQEESPQARPRLRRLADSGEATLCYVSGRGLQLMHEAIDEYSLPLPHYAVGDVGTTIYRVEHGRWIAMDEWRDRIGNDWNGREAGELEELLPDLPMLEKQEPAKQNRHKLSFYAPADADSDKILSAIRERFDEHDIRASLIWSVHEEERQGLLDILPERATKLHAVEFLIDQQGFSRSRTVYVGDSGNDLPVLTSDIQAVLVANASDDVRRRAKEQSNDDGTLYFAAGGFLGMNGNYAAGALEGLAHYFPEADAWLGDQSASK